MAMEKFEVSSFEEFETVVQMYSTTNYSFRGHANVEWELIPKIGRLEYFQALTDDLTEEKLLNSWRRYSEHHLITKPVDKWDTLTLAQHHGLATRFLDWTKNPLVALYFATEDITLKKDACVFIFDFLNRTILTEQCDPFSIDFSGVFYPKGLSARVINQRGIFSISHKPTKPLDKLLPKNTFKKVIIKAKAIPKIRKKLEFYGINEYSIYQDLDSLSKYLNRFLIEKKVEEILNTVG